jgi:hypothetical protein
MSRRYSHHNKMALITIRWQPSAILETDGVSETASFTETFCGGVPEETKKSIEEFSAKKGDSIRHFGNARGLRTSLETASIT